MILYTALFLVALLAGVQNALAGGGSFLTFPALLVTGLDARGANITSTIALFPGQITTGLAGRRFVAGAGRLSFRALFVISIAGGAAGAALLLVTPASIFERLVPWLVLFATGVFVWGNFIRRPGQAATTLSAPVAVLAQFLIAVYGGYFGGGIGILMLAVLTMAGQTVRAAAATKNVLAGVMNASAVLIFLFSRGVAWPQAAVVAAGAVIGGQGGAWLLWRVNERGLRIAIACLGLALAVGLFVRTL